MFFFTDVTAESADEAGITADEIPGKCPVVRAVIVILHPGQHYIYAAPSADMTEPLAETDKTIKSKTSGPDFSKLADEISAAFKKIFSK